MARKPILSPWTIAAVSCISITMPAFGQATPRIQSQVEGSAMVAIPGTVNPLARAEYDRGAAPASLHGHMLVVLKRSEEQEADLRALLASQQDPTSPNYHKWLTAESYGKRFGVADADLQTVTSYLAGQGLQVGRVYKNHGMIEIGGTAEQVRAAFQSEIHAYAIGGKTFYANSTPLKVPAAMRGVVAGFASISNFHTAGTASQGVSAQFDPETHTLKPLYSTTTSTGAAVYAVTPGDLRAIYSIPLPTAPGAGGAGVNVGVLGDSNINVSYVNNYRSLFGLISNPPIVVVDGNDPGINSDAAIAYKQIELISAVAPNATIYYYTSATTDYDSGIDFALGRAVEDAQVQVLVNGFQSCETALGSNIAYINAAYEQAAAEGITVVAAAGNSGAAGCEVPGATTPATTGLAVNGYATSPYVTAVGGTDFYYDGNNPASRYWAPAPSAFTSATTYIPEQTWNDSVQTSDATPGAVVSLAGGGGISTAGVDGVSTAQPIPGYQASNPQALAISNRARMVPDIALFAGTGANNNFGYNASAYAFCMKSTDCQTTNTQFTYDGGTEASSAVFAGVMALIDNRVNGTGAQFGLGAVNNVLYTVLTNGAVINHDINKNSNGLTSSNKLACTNGTPNCSGGTLTGYTTGAGYDVATGLGSFNIGSLVSGFTFGTRTASNVTISVTDPATGLPPSCTIGSVKTPDCTVHSTYLTFRVTATNASGPGTPTGDVFIYTSSPLEDGEGVVSLPLVNGVATLPSWNLLPGGTYRVYARYAGDSTFAPSVTAAPYKITVLPEACKFDTFFSNVGGGFFTFGSPVKITAQPYSTTNPSNVARASGSVNVLDNGSLLTTLPINSEGSVSFISNQLPFGSHSLVFSFGGDSSFGSCQSQAFPLSVSKASTSITLDPTSADLSQGQISLTATVRPQLSANGTPPTGTVTFTITPNGGTATTPAPVPVVTGFDVNGNAVATANILVGSTLTANGGTVTAIYNGDSNYNASPRSSTSNLASSSSIFALNVPSTTTFTITDTDNTPVNGSFPALDSITLHIHVDTGVAPPTSGGTFSVLADGIQLVSGLAPDGNGNATYTFAQQNGFVALPSGQVALTVIYSGHSFIFFVNVAESEASSATQNITIADDRTASDFALSSDKNVNQQNPLISTGSTQAIYNLRLTSLANFQAAYPNTPVNLSCAVVGYATFSGVRSTPTGLQCGFSSAYAATAAPNFGSSPFITQQLFVGAASTFSIASTHTTETPASRWWIATGTPALACVFLLCLPGRRRAWQSTLGAFSIVVLGLTMSGCGVNVANGPEKSYYSQLLGGSGAQGTSGTAVPAGVYTVMVTGTAATNTTVVHTLPIQVVVGVQP